jgi:hypothetical protein
MHLPQHEVASNQSSSPDVLVNNVGTLSLTLRAKEWIDDMFRTTHSGSGTHLSSNIVMRGDWHRRRRMKGWCWHEPRCSYHETDTVRPEGRGREAHPYGKDAEPC